MKIKMEILKSVFDDHLRDFELADAIYELKGNAQLPVENVAIKDVKVGLLRSLLKKRIMSIIF